jgi:hypothetical protein
MQFICGIFGALLGIYIGEFLIIRPNEKKRIAKLEVVNHIKVYIRNHGIDDYIKPYLKYLPKEDRDLHVSENIVQFRKRHE